VWDHSTDTCDPVYYDFVYVCNGHYTEPDIPSVEGMDLFEGKKMHSHLYRKADKFKGEIRWPVACILFVSVCQNQSSGLGNHSRLARVPLLLFPINNWSTLESR